MSSRAGSRREDGVGSVCGRGISKSGSTEAMWGGGRVASCFKDTGEMETLSISRTADDSRDERALVGWIELALGSVISVCATSERRSGKHCS